MHQVDGFLLHEIPIHDENVDACAMGNYLPADVDGIHFLHNYPRDRTWTTTVVCRRNQTSMVMIGNPSFNLIFFKNKLRLFVLFKSI